MDLPLHLPMILVAVILTGKGNAQTVTMSWVDASNTSITTVDESDGQFCTLALLSAFQTYDVVIRCTPVLSTTVVAACPDIDYGDIPLITITAGDTSAFVCIALVNDTVKEANDNIEFDCVDVLSGLVVNDAGSLPSTDDDAGGDQVQFGFSTSVYTEKENNNASIKINFDKFTFQSLVDNKPYPIDELVTIVISSQTIGTGVLDDTAEDGTDLTSGGSYLFDGTTVPCTSSWSISNTTTSFLTIDPTTPSEVESLERFTAVITYTGINTMIDPTRNSAAIYIIDAEYDDTFVCVDMSSFKRSSKEIVYQHMFSTSATSATWSKTNMKQVRDSRSRMYMDSTLTYNIMTVEIPKPGKNTGKRFGVYEWTIGSGKLWTFVNPESKHLSTPLALTYYAYPTVDEEDTLEPITVGVLPDSKSREFRWRYNGKLKNNLRAKTFQKLTTRREVGTYEIFRQDRRKRAWSLSFRVTAATCMRNKYYNSTTPGCVALSKECQNKGHAYPTADFCVCPPGYIGRNCAESVKRTLDTTSKGVFGQNNIVSVSQAKNIRSKKGEGILICQISPPLCYCAQGYGGTHCKDRCKSGTFGPNCAQTVNCKDTQVYDPTDGFCANGECSAGYFGYNCQFS